MTTTKKHIPFLEKKNLILFLFDRKQLFIICKFWLNQRTDCVNCMTIFNLAVGLKLNANILACLDLLLMIIINQP